MVHAGSALSRILGAATVGEYHRKVTSQTVMAVTRDDRGRVLVGPAIDRDMGR